MTDLPLAEPLRADLAEMDVVLCAGLIRGTKCNDVPNADRDAAKTLRQHFERLLSRSPSTDQVRVGASAAFRDVRFAVHEPDAAGLERAINLLLEMENGQLAIESAKELLDCIADVHFGPSAE